MYVCLFVCLPLCLSVYSCMYKTICLNSLSITVYNCLHVSPSQFSPVGNADTVGPATTTFPGVNMRSDVAATPKQQDSAISSYTSGWKSVVSDGKSLVAGLFSSTPDGDGDTTLASGGVPDRQDASSQPGHNAPPDSDVVRRPRDGLVFAPAWVWIWVGFAAAGTTMYGVVETKKRRRGRASSDLTSGTGRGGSDISSIESAPDLQSATGANETTTAYRRVPMYDTF
jgi:hypothetical protein